MTIVVIGALRVNFHKKNCYGYSSEMADEYLQLDFCREIKKSVLPPAIRRMVERAYSVSPVCLSMSGVSNLSLSFSGGGILVLWTHF